jgi:hypothetical protein
MAARYTWGSVARGLLFVGVPLTIFGAAVLTVVLGGEEEEE